VLGLAVTAESPLLAVSSWINQDLQGSRQNPGPVNLGAVIEEYSPPRSPATGAFVILTQAPESVRSPVAEDDAVTTCRIVHLVVSAKPATANSAAMALAAAIRSVAPPARSMGGMTCLTTGNVQGPVSVPGPGVDQWDYCQQVTADYTLYDSDGGA